MRRPLTTIMVATAMVVTAVGTASAGSPDEAAVEALVPDDAADRIAEMDARLGLDTPWRQALRSAIDPDDYECEPTEFNTWIDDLLDRTDLDALVTIDQLGATAWPTYYSLLFDDDPDDDTIGVDGEHTREQRRRHRDAQRFWDVETGDVRLHGMHGADIADDAKMVPTVQVLFGVDAGTAQAIVDFVQSVIGGEPTISYDHPLFTLNAFAFTSEGEEIIPGLGVIPDKIVMGEGILVALDEMGIGDAGPDFVHAHEFAHHVQFEIGAFDSDLPAPEATRRTELMADAFAAYNTSHVRGATFQTKRIVEVVRSAYDVGDCAFDNPGHHGTPNQREAAAEWGVELSQSARPRSTVLSSTTMLDLFEDELATFLLPDA